MARRGIRTHAHLHGFSEWTFPTLSGAFRPLGQLDSYTLVRCRENINGNLFVYFFGTKDYKWYINEIDALFHINSTILSHPRKDNICVAKNTAVLSTRRVETR